MQQGDKDTILRAAQDLEDVGIKGLTIECRPVAKNGDRVRAAMNLTTGAVEIISVNGEKDPEKIKLYSNLLTFDIISGMGRSQIGQFRRNEDFKHPKDMTPEEWQFFSAQETEEGKTKIMAVET